MLTSNPLNGSAFGCRSMQWGEVLRLARFCMKLPKEFHNVTSYH